MDRNNALSDIPLKEKIEQGLITREQLRARSKTYWMTLDNNMPVNVNGKFRCPVCLSKLDENSRLVCENGYIVCDYCVNYVEDYT